jgi:hypothetical protein
MNNGHVDRRAKRLRMKSSVLLRNGTGSRMKAHLFNISQYGCALLTENTCLREGAIYSLKTEGVELLVGRVVWARNLWAGLEFTQPLHPAVADHLATKDGTNIPEYGGDDLLHEMVRHETRQPLRPFDPPARKPV